MKISDTLVFYNANLPGFTRCTYIYTHRSHIEQQSTELYRTATINDYLRIFISRNFLEFRPERTKRKYQISLCSQLTVRHADSRDTADDRRSTAPFAAGCSYRKR